MDAPTNGDGHSIMDEDDVREYRLHHWLNETAVTARLMQDARADSPVLGFDHTLQLDSNKPLPELPASLSRLRSPTGSTATTGSGATVNPLTHLRSLSSSQSQPPSRRPSLARKSSLPLLAESVPLPQSPPSPVPPCSRLHSINSSLSLGSNRNAVYIDSEQVSNRLDSWLLSGDPEFERENVDDLDVAEYYVTDFERNPDSPQALFTTFPRSQGPPPNTPMTGCYVTPDASSSQIYLGKPSLSKDDSMVTSINPLDQEDVRATPVPHTRSPGPHLSISSSTSSSNSAEDFPTSRTSSGSSPALPPASPERSLKSKPSLAELSMGLMAPRPSLASVGLGYQSYLSTPAGTNLLSPPPATASRWSLTSSVAGDIENHKKKKDKGLKPKGGTRKRLASFINKLANTNNTLKESKENLSSLPSSSAPSPAGEELERSPSKISIQANTDRVLPPVERSPRPKPPSLKLAPVAATLTKSHSVSNLLSPTLSSKPSLSSLSIPFSPTTTKTSSQSSSTPTPTTTFATSPVSALFTPSSPVNASFASSTRLSLSASMMTTTSTTTASPLMPNTPILSDVPLVNGVGGGPHTLKSVMSVPLLSPTFEAGGGGPGLLQRDSSFGWSLNSSSSSYYNDGGSLPTSPTKDFDDDEDDIDDDDDLEDDAAYYVREFSLTRRNPSEAERKARLSLIADMLDRDMKTSPSSPPPPQQPQLLEGKKSSELPPPSVRSVRNKPKPVVKVNTTNIATAIATTTTTSVPIATAAGTLDNNAHHHPTAHFRKSSTISRTSLMQRRSASNPSSPISPSSPPPLPTTTNRSGSGGGFRNFAARMGISNSISTPQSPPPPPAPALTRSTTKENPLQDSTKRKSIASLMSNGKRKGPKRRLVISGVGDKQGEVEALKEWCSSLGEVRSMVKVKSAAQEGGIGEVIEIGHGEGSGHNVWVVDFKKNSVAETVCRLQAKVEIKGAGSVRLSWETTKPRIGFGMGRKGWIP